MASHDCKTEASVIGPERSYHSPSPGHAEGWMRWHASMTSRPRLAASLAILPNIAR